MSQLRENLRNYEKTYEQMKGWTQGWTEDRERDPISQEPSSQGQGSKNQIEAPEHIGEIQDYPSHTRAAAIFRRILK